MVAFGHRWLVQLFSHVGLCSLMDCSMPGFPVLHQLPELAQAHVHWVSDALQPSHPLSSPSPAALDLSQHQGLWPKYWSFSFNISSSNEYSGLISSRIDCFDLLAVQGTLKSLLQHHTVQKHQISWCFLYSPILTFIHNYWKNHSFDYMDLY